MAQWSSQGGHSVSTPPSTNYFVDTGDNVKYFLLTFAYLDHWEFALINVMHVSRLTCDMTHPLMHHRAGEQKQNMPRLAAQFSVFVS